MVGAVVSGGAMAAGGDLCAGGVEASQRTDMSAKDSWPAPGALMFGSAAEGPTRRGTG